jgi:hypothetical protein
MPITGAKVTYSRTVQVAQFEPRKVEIEISFTVNDKEDFEQLMDDAKTLARTEVNELVKQRDGR